MSESSVTAKHLALSVVLAAIVVGLPACGNDGGSGGGDGASGAADVAAADDAHTATDGLGAEDGGPEPDPCDGLGQLAACDDGNPCTESDRCLDGRCTGALKTCDDGSGCTVGTCDPEAGCQYEPVAGACNDDDTCTVEDSCADGVCIGSPISGAGCDDSDPCTLDDVCTDGTCAGILNLCNDLNPCTQDFCDTTHEQALGTGCVHLGIDSICDDTNPCTADDACVDGTCTGEVMVGAPCSDGDLCTDGEVCQTDGSCSGGSAGGCDDGNPCTIDSCDDEGGCVFTPDVGLACDDEDPCSVEDACQADGACSGVAKCTNEEPCVDIWCDTETGACETADVDCNDFEQCTAESCVFGTGCVYEDLTQACDDGDLCTLGDVCSGGECTGAEVPCSDMFDTQCTKNLCAPESGECVPTDLDGLGCSDGDKCTDLDHCEGGECVAWPVDCGDFDPCTVDTCIAESGACENTPKEVCEDKAFERANEYRSLIDLPLLGNHQAIIDAATAHCEYYVENKAEVYDGMGLSPHGEAPGYDGFTGEGFGARMAAAGYPNSPLFEVMAFVNDPVISVDEWMATLYHRIPFVVPVATEMGYGAAQKGFEQCDTIDFGTTNPELPQYADAIIPFPPDGSSNVPTWWDGLESPQPPLPNPYPSGPILTVTFGKGGGGVGISILDSTINSENGPVPHVANTSTTDPDLCCGVIALYANQPMEPLTVYTVTLEYSRNGVPGTFEWSFITDDGTGKYFLH